MENALKKNQENDSDFNQFKISLKYQFLSYIRTRRFIGLAIFSLAMSILVMALMLHTEYSTLKAADSVSFFYQYLSEFTVLFTLLISAFFGGDLISTDTGTNAAYYTLVQPVRRSVLFLGRFIAAIIAAFIVIFLYFLVGILSSLYLYGTVSVLILNSLGLLVLFIAAGIAFSSLFSGIFKSPSNGIVVSILIFVLGFSIIDEILGALEGIEPLFSIYFVGEIVYLVFDNNYPTKVISSSRFGPHGVTTYTFLPSIPQGIYVLLTYIILFGILSILIYTRRQIEG